MLCFIFYKLPVKLIAKYYSERTWKICEKEFSWVFLWGVTAWAVVTSLKGVVSEGSVTMGGVR